MSATVADVRRAGDAPDEEHLNVLAIGIAEHLHGLSLADARLILNKATRLLEESSRVDVRTRGFQAAIERRHAFLRLHPKGNGDAQ